MLAGILLCLALLSFGQEPEGRRQPSTQQPTPTPQAVATPAGPTQPQRGGPQERPTPPVEEPPVVTHHEVRAGGRTLRYTATTGMMPIKNREGETEARIFFMAYTLDDDAGRNRRPLT